MSAIRVYIVVFVVSAGAFATGRITAEPGVVITRPPTVEVMVTMTPSPEASVEPIASPAGAAGRILSYFAYVSEQNLPRQGVLGGTMVAGTVALPKGFEGRANERFYVVGGDGHIIVTWTFEMRRGGGWRLLSETDGYAPVDFERHLDDFDVYLWRPAYYVEAAPVDRLG